MSKCWSIGLCFPIIGYFALYTRKLHVCVVCHRHSVGDYSLWYMATCT